MKALITGASSGIGRDMAIYLAEKHNLGLTKEIAEKAIPNCAFVFTPAKKSKAQIEQLLKLFGQKLPDSKFYY